MTVSRWTKPVPERPPLDKMVQAANEVAQTARTLLASMLAAVGLTVTAAVLRVPLVLLVSSVAVTVFVIVRHRANISRLLAGTESKIGQKPAHPSP